MTRFLPAVFAFAVIEFGIACWELLPGVGARLTAWLPADNPSSQAPPREVKQAKQENLSRVSVVLAVGELRATDETPVTAPLSGVLDEISFPNGVSVSAGRVIAVIRPTELLDRIRQTEAELRSARAQLEKKENLFKEAESGADRLRDLWQRDLIARQDLSGAEEAMIAARAEAELAGTVVAQEQARLEQLRYQLGFAKVTAPFDGVITHRFSGVQSRVAQGQPILAYGSLNSLRIRIAVPVAEAELIEQGVPAEITIPGFPDRIFTAVVTEIWPAGEGAATTDVELELANKDHVLRPGMRASVVVPQRAKLTRYFLADPRFS